MNKTVKYLLGAGAALVVILVVVVGGVLGKLDSIVEGVIESVGSEVVGTEVAVSGVSIDLAGGSAAIAGLTLANPGGFDAPLAFSLGGIAVAIDVASVTKSPIIINSITVDKPQVWFETNEAGESNLDQIMASIGTGESAEEPETESGEPIMLVIKRFSFTGGTINANDKATGKQVEAELPAIALSNIGGSSGATPGAVASVIVKKLVSESIAAALAQGIKDKAEEGLKDKLKGVFKKD